MLDITTTELRHLLDGQVLRIRREICRVLEKWKQVESLLEPDCGRQSGKASDVA